MSKTKTRKADNALSYFLLVFVILIQLCAAAIGVYFLAYFPILSEGALASAWAVVLWVSGFLIIALFWFVLSQALSFSWRMTRVFLILNGLILTPVVGKYFYIVYSAQG